MSARQALIQASGNGGEAISKKELAEREDPKTNLLHVEASSLE
jgi:hypothetical protein